MTQCDPSSVWRIRDFFNHMGTAVARRCSAASRESLLTSTLGVQSRRCAAVCGPPPTSSSSLSTASPSPSARSSFLIRRRCRFARSCPRAVNVLNFACQCCRVVGTWSIAWQMAAGGVQWRHEQYETHVELPVGCCSCIVNASDKNIVCLARLQPPRRVRAKRVLRTEMSSICALQK